MRRFNKLLSLVLAIVMMVGLLPLSIFAADTTRPVVVLACSDFQAQGTGDEGQAKNSATNVNSILKKIEADYDHADGLIFCGDLDYDNSYMYISNGIAYLKRAFTGYSDWNLASTKFTGIFDNAAEDSDYAIYVQGNHDTIDQGQQGLSSTGAHDTADYGVFVIDENDYRSYWNGGAATGNSSALGDDIQAVQAVASSLETYFNQKIAEGYTKPIFITSHVPLHFSSRTIAHGDEKFGKYIFDKVNAAAEAGLTIIYLCGHNHSGGYDDYLGGAAYYFEPGDQIRIANPPSTSSGKTSTYTTETLAFTYMNAGYVGYYDDKISGVDNDTTLTMTAFEITDSQVKITRYDANGVHNLKSAGYDTAYNGNSSQSMGGFAFDGASADRMPGAVASPRYVTLSDTAEPAAEPTDFFDADTGIFVSTVADALDASEDTTFTTDNENIAKCKAYDITLEGYEMGTAATVRIPVPAGYDTSKTKVYWANGTKLVNMGAKIADGYAEFTTNHFSTYVVAETTGTVDIDDDEWIDVNDNVYTYYYTLDTDGVDSGAHYVILAPEADVALIDNNGIGAKNDLTFVDGAIVLNQDEYNVADWAIASNGTTTGPDIHTGDYRWTDHGNISNNVGENSGYYYKVGDNYYALTSATREPVTNYTKATPRCSQVTDKGNWTQTNYYYEVEGNFYRLFAKREGNQNKRIYHWGYSTTGNADNVTEIGTQGNGSTKGIDDQTINIDVYTATSTYEWTIVYEDGTEKVTANTITLYTYDEIVNNTYPAWSVASHRTNNAYLRIRDNAFAFVNSNESKFAINNAGSGLYNMFMAGNAGPGAATATFKSLKYNNGWTVGSDTTDTVRLYKLTNTVNTPTTLYSLAVEAGDFFGVKADGNLTLNLSTAAYANQAALEEAIRNNLTVYMTEDKTDVDTPINDVEYTLTSNPASFNTSVAGTYTYTVSYNGTVLKTITVTLTEAQITKVEISSFEGTVYRGAKKTANTGATITVYYDDGTFVPVPVTLNLLTGNFDRNTIGDYEDLTVSYGGETFDFTLHVIANPSETDYPEFPDAGSVQVDKKANGIEFQKTGVAQIELSTSGISVDKGVDVIVMLDTSSSMGRDKNNQNTNVVADKRITMLQHSLEEMFGIFTKPNDDGTLPDIRVAVGDFNGFTFLNGGSGSASNDYVGDTNYSQNPTAKIFTGDGSIGLGAFVDAGSINVNSLNSAIYANMTSGTNYDYAFDTIYKLGRAITEENTSNGEDRELYVIFMSDGATFQYNYFYSKNTQATWEGWLDGSIDLNSTSVHSNSHKYFFYADDDDNTVQKHRMAEAIKGSTSDEFEVILPGSTTTNDLGEHIDGQDYMFTVPGLGATMYSIGFCITEDGSVPIDPINATIRAVASIDGGERLYYDADNQDELDTAFTQIASNIKMAASNAYFVDTMGPAYDVKFTPITDKAGNSYGAPTIEVKAYDIYTTNDFEKGIIKNKDLIGTRKGDAFQTIETVTFNEAGTAAYSNGGTTNILVNGVINASTFWYNSKSTAVRIDTNGDGEDDYTLPAETFYWKIGAVGEKELALSYYVYLTGALEGTRDEGSYPTNESATLYYTNWLGNDAHKDTVSPSMPWGAATVRCAFYLVNEDGEVIVNQSTGLTGSFADRVVITRPIEYAKIFLNNNGEVSATIAASDVLPTYYTLYDPAATYTVTVDSAGENSNWAITGTDGKADTTYVADYGGDPTTRRNEDSATYDYTNTTVWFAVKYIVKAYPDTVVIDYGLPVDIHVLSNDMFGYFGTVAGVGAANAIPTGTYTTENNFTDSSITLKYGSASVNGSTVRYTPANMQMDGVDTFAYSVYYNNTNKTDNNGYYYGTVTVVPATTIYYEDSFVTYTGDWVNDSINDTGVFGVKTQNEDRPGFYNLSESDADSLYGFDSQYTNYLDYSLGGTKKVTVNADPNGGAWPTATFTFTGTGFDIISLTSKDTGYIRVKVFEGTKASGTAYKSWGVDTFYGYTAVQDGYNECVWTYRDGNWYVAKTPVEEEGEATERPADPISGSTFTTYEPNYTWELADSSNALYQIPVLKGHDFPYGTYTVQITPTYASFFDHVGDKDGEFESYDFYLDAVRIYDPADTSAEVIDYYKLDNEAFPQYIEIRDKLIGQDGFGEVGKNETDQTIFGAVFIDGLGTSGTISDYTSFGPNNEVYLVPGQAIAFMLQNDDPENIASIQIGAKAVQAATEMSLVDITGSATAKTLETSTDMYYNVTGLITWARDTDDNLTGTTNPIVLTNTGKGILSLTQIKITYKEDPNAAPASGGEDATAIVVSPDAAEYAVKAVNNLLASKAPVYVAPVLPKGKTEVITPEIAVDAEEIETEIEGIFVPEEFKVSLSKTSAQVGKTVKMTITTSSEVSSVWVNGEKAAMGTTDRKTGKITWTYIVNCTSAGTMKISTTAHNAAGVSSKAITSTITVTTKKVK